MKSFKQHVSEATDRWYKEQPEWGTPESTKKAKKKTPGESVKEEALDEISRAAADKYKWAAVKDQGGKQSRINHNTRNMRKDSRKLTSLLPGSRWNKNKKENEKLAKDIAKRHKGINRANKLYPVEEEAPMGANTGSIPDSSDSGPKKRKRSLVTKHYIEVNGKRKRQVVQ